MPGPKRRKEEPMSETEPNEPPIREETSGDDGEDYGAKASDDQEPTTPPERTPVPEAD
jgi:hypothetical protein